MRTAVLAVILSVAAVLRFTGLRWGLRHPPHIDEHSFVQPMAAMIAAGDWNHRFHEYPGLLFYVLAPFVAAADPTGGPDAYFVSRVVIAAFSTANVLLAWRLGCDMVGPRAGLFAAALLAVSPLEVRTAHMLRPDVALETAALAALIALRRLGGGLRSDATAGAAVGVATALKFSGALLAIPFLARGLAVPGARWRSLAVAAAAALVAFALLSPATFVHREDAVAGAVFQVRYHYVARDQPAQTYAQQLLNYGTGLVLGLGAPAALLVPAGLLLWRRQWRDWLPLVVFPLAIVLTFSTADVRYLRHLLPSLGGLAVVAGRAVEGLRLRSAALTAVVCATAIAVPLATSAGYVRGITQPSTLDRAADWIEAHLPPQSRVLATARAPIGLDGSRFEVLRIERLDESNRRLAAHFDLVAAGAREDRAATVSLRRRALFPSPDRDLGGPVALLATPEGSRPRYERVSLGDAFVQAAPEEENLDLLRDGDLGTAWKTSRPQGPGSWVEITLPRPRRLGRIELALGPHAEAYGRNVHLWMAESGDRWRRVPALPGRAPVPEQVPTAPRSQVLLFEPVETDRLRLVQQGRSEDRWAIAELWLDALAAGAPAHAYP